jgi:hypothetical protein
MRPGPAGKASFRCVYLNTTPRVKCGVTGVYGRSHHSKSRHYMEVSRQLHFPTTWLQNKFLRSCTAKRPAGSQHMAGSSGRQKNLQRIEPGFLGIWARTHVTLRYSRSTGIIVDQKLNIPKPLVRTRNAKCNRKSFSSFQNGTKGRTFKETVTSFFDHLTLKVKAMWYFEMERTAHPKTQLYFRADFLYSAVKPRKKRTHIEEKYTSNEVVCVREASDLAISIN